MVAWVDGWGIREQIKWVHLVPLFPATQWFPRIPGLCSQEHQQLFWSEANPGLNFFLVVMLYFNWDHWGSQRWGNLCDPHMQVKSMCPVSEISKIISIIFHVSWVGFYWTNNLSQSHDHTGTRPEHMQKETWDAYQTIRFSCKLRKQSSWGIDFYLIGFPLRHFPSAL